MQVNDNSTVRRVAVVLDQAYHFHRQVFPGILAYQKRHPHLQFSTWNGSPILSEELLERVEADGVIAQLNAEGHFARLRRLGLPFVNVSNLLARGGPRVICADAAVGRMAAEHLWESGLRHFVFCGFKGHRYSEERWKGFAAFVQEKGATAQCFRHEPGSMNLPFARLPRPAGIFAANDRLALVVIHYARLAGMQIPDEAAVIGVDNDVVQAEMLQTPLTSVQPDCRQIGWEALALLDAAIRSGQHPANRVHVRVPPLHVVARASTDLLFIEDTEIRRALRWMRANFGRIKGVDEIIARLPMSRRTFELRFHKVVDRSPHQELARLRWQHARERLQNTKLTLQEIGEECGFQNMKDFSAFFSRHEGVSPGRFRKVAPPVD